MHKPFFLGLFVSLFSTDKAEEIQNSYSKNLKENLDSVFCTS